VYLVEVPRASDEFQMVNGSILDLAFQLKNAGFLSLVSFNAYENVRERVGLFEAVMILFFAIT